MPRILIVDDEPEIGRILGLILRGAGFEVAAVEGGRAALMHLAGSPTDLVLLDVTMPELDGFEILRRIRLSPATATLPVLMLTAKAGAADRIRAESLGADDYIDKPFDPVDVVERVRARLRN
jgi:DNA-binding response OmpR family regulator